MNHAEKVKGLLDRLNASYGPEASITDNELAYAAVHAAIDEMQAEIDRAQLAVRHEADCMEAAKAEIARLSKDAERLDWMSSREARIGWNREGDMCWVWLRDDDEACGWSTDWSRSFDSHRDAIDAAMKARGGKT